MNNQVKEKKQPSLLLSILPVLVTIGFLVIAIRLEAAIHIPLILGATFTAIIAVFVLGYKWVEIEEGIVASISSTLQAILILAIIGVIIGTWIIGGIVPTLIYYGLQILSPTFFLAASLLLCSVVSLATGSSWTTAGTVGIALIGIAQGLNIPIGLAAGAIISGAYFGDKISPLSDTTNLAPAMAGAKLFDHVKHMLYTTSISYSITLVLFVIIGFKFSGQELNSSEIQGILDVISANFNINPVLLLVPVIVIIMVAMKVPALPGLFIGALLGGACAFIFQGSSLSEVLGAMMNGFESTTGHAMVDELMTRGGLMSMMNTIALIMSALSFGGVLEKSGMLACIANKLLSFAKSTGSLILVTILSCLFVNILAGDQYLAIALPGKMYKDEFRKRGLAPRNLSRALEDSGTVTSALVPWNTCGATMSTFLGVPTITYLPFTFFNLLSPIVSTIAGYVGYSIMKLEDDPSAEEYTGTKVKKAKA